MIEAAPYMVIVGYMQTRLWIHFPHIVDLLHLILLFTVIYEKKRPTYMRGSYYRRRMEFDSGSLLY